VFAVATALARHPDLAASMTEAGWEIASHGLRQNRDAQMLRATTTISSRPPALDHNTISSPTSKRQSGASPPMITIPGTSDHHHLEFAITITWND
jgi:hypothetical protein